MRCGFGRVAVGVFPTLLEAEDLPLGFGQLLLHLVGFVQVLLDLLAQVLGFLLFLEEVIGQVHGAHDGGVQGGSVGRFGGLSDLFVYGLGDLLDVGFLVGTGEQEGAFCHGHFDFFVHISLTSSLRAYLSLHRFIIS